ncbi:DNA/RNA non-specific endonuclease [Niabella soli]|uniref:DNA/RNA non-specific endonuclease/pyrophosphatase/phosphodiesterase domain-containing protein n=1 Tax=Niabella soli DSM 19437 TaxID=929713 RepID=W0F2J0_9BACT|nr:DNA/RNA non-specific endonuclease [Niabella soli]AHF17232.1 hypothetical protein NIASO_04155 [Niabella soli DSM 19437]
MAANMIPQAPQNNQRTWNDLETYIRSQVTAGQEVYIITGSYGRLGTIDAGHIVIPSNIWKVVVFLKNGNNDLKRINAGTRVLAVNTPIQKQLMPIGKNILLPLASLKKIRATSCYRT